jgi:hypothetical protein
MEHSSDLKRGQMLTIENITFHISDDGYVTTPDG